MEAKSWRGHNFITKWVRRQVAADLSVKIQRRILEKFLEDPFGVNYTNSFQNKQINNMTAIKI